MFLRRRVAERGPLKAAVIGVGAFGSGFTDCQSRFGELLSVAGATAYQPTDEANVPDYLVHAGGQSDVHVLYCLACEGRFSHVIRFEALAHGGTVGMGQLLAGCLETAGTNSIGVVVVAEAAGLIGAALRRSPAAPTPDSTRKKITSCQVGEKR